MDRLSTPLRSLNHNRFLLFYGIGIEDVFIAPTLQELNIFEALNDELKRMGFKRIIYTSLDRPIYFLDTESKKLSDDLYTRPLQQRPNQREAIQPGPFGERLVIPTQNPQWNVFTQAIGDSHAVRLLDEWMCEVDGVKTVIVFNQFESYMQLHQDARTLNSVINKWLKLPTANVNRAIFLFSGQSIDELRQASQQWPVPEFRTIISGDVRKPNPHVQTMHVPGPHEDELNRLIQIHVENRSQAMNHNDVSKLTRIMTSEGVQLRLWSERLAQVPAVSIEDFRTQGWISSSHSTDHSANDELSHLVGLDEIKQRIKDITAWYQLKHSTSSDQATNLHMVFSGNPGTGKTTVARLFGEIYHDAGILHRGHLIEVKAADLVADFVGGTAIKTNELIDQALDGVLFVDEAYALSEKDRGGFGAEALETLLTRMENDRNRLVVILAGYPEPIAQLLRSNPGISRRFPEDNRFVFPDFSVDQLTKIFDDFLASRSLTCNDALFNQFASIIHSMVDQKSSNFGNGGAIRNFVDSLERRGLSRLSATQTSPPFELSADDISPEYRAYLTPNLPDTNSLLVEVDQLIGLENVKRWLRRTVARIQFERSRKESSRSDQQIRDLRHLMFVGNPGTGKTTLARLVGKIYKSIGLLRKGHLVEVSMPDLIAGYVGQTSGKVMEQIQNAIGGVLFIDEAYALVRNNAFFQGSYGQEVVDTLVKAIEDHRGKMLVIMAGYPTEMDVLMRSNPGLRSRFAPAIHFPDFAASQINALLTRLAHADEMNLSESVKEAAVSVLLDHQAQAPLSFGNARDTISLYEQMKDRLAERIMPNAKQTRDGKYELPEGWNKFCLSDVNGDEFTVIIQGKTSESEQANIKMKSWVVPKTPLV